MYMVHTSAWPFKDKRFQRQVPTCTSTLAHTSNQFHSSQRLGLNHTPRMQTGLSLQQKGPARGTPPLQAPSHRPSLLSKLILAPATSSYLLTAFFTAFMSNRQDTKTVISSAYAETFILTQPAKSTPRRAGFAIPSPCSPAPPSFAELQFESGGLQKPMVHPIKGLGLI